MYLKRLIVTLLMTASTLTFAETHKEAAIHHIKLTDLAVTFGITSEGVQKNIEDYQKKLLNAFTGNAKGYR
jgi:hypothetical protein